MRIVSIAATFPSRKVTNEDVLQEVRAASKSFKGDLEQTISRISRALRHSGTNVRYWTNGSGESSLSLTIEACRKAMAACEGKKIDMVICASVYAELIEPATSNLVAHELGLFDAECMDLKEACDGWVKAMKVAKALIQTGDYERILVVNGEFSMAPNYAIMPRLFNLESAAQLEWRFPIFTIGEAATAVIVERDDLRAWRFTNLTHNGLYDLCTVAPPWHRRGQISGRVAMDGPGMFTSWASDLTRNGIPLVIETFKKSGIDPADVDILFTHAHSKTDWGRITDEIGLSNKHFEIHGRTGNLVSASIPAAMALALDEGVLQRGQIVAILCASAGMTFSAASFQF